MCYTATKKYNSTQLLGGSASVGKTEVANAIVQSVLRYASSQPTHDPESMPECFWNDALLYF